MATEKNEWAGIEGGVGGAIEGGQTGSSAGIWGTIIGAVVGGVSGYMQGEDDEQARLDNERRKEQLKRREAENKAFAQKGGPRRSGGGVDITGHDDVLVSAVGSGSQFDKWHRETF